MFEPNSASTGKAAAVRSVEVGEQPVGHERKGTRRRCSMTSGRRGCLQRRRRTRPAGAVYGLGPGVVLVAEYAWGENSQNGFNFLQNTDTGPTRFNSNKVWAQVLTAGMSVRF